MHHFVSNLCGSDNIQMMILNNNTTLVSLMVESIQFHLYFSRNFIREMSERFWYFSEDPPRGLACFREISGVLSVASVVKQHGADN